MLLVFLVGQLQIKYSLKLDQVIKVKYYTFRADTFEYVGILSDWFTTLKLKGITSSL